MRRLGAGRLAALMGSLLAVSVAPAQAQTYKPEPMMQGKLWDSWFSNSSSSSSSPKAEVVDPMEAPGTMPTPTDRVMQHERLRRAYLRRSKVCLRLQEIALETNNPALEEEALSLDEMAFAIYMKQCKQLGLGSGVAPGMEELDTGKPARHSAAVLSQSASGGILPERNRDGQGAPELGQQTSATREDER